MKSSYQVLKGSSQILFLFLLGELLTLNFAKDFPVSLKTVFSKMMRCSMHLHQFLANVSKALHKQPDQILNSNLVELNISDSFNVS